MLSAGPTHTREAERSETGRRSDGERAAVPVPRTPSGAASGFASASPRRRPGARAGARGGAALSLRLVKTGGGASLKHPPDKALRVKGLAPGRHSLARREGGRAYSVFRTRVWWTELARKCSALYSVPNHRKSCGTSSGRCCARARTSCML